jgi:hypothetical protein
MIEDVNRTRRELKSEALGYAEPFCDCQINIVDWIQIQQAAASIR